MKHNNARIRNETIHEISSNLFGQNLPTRSNDQTPRVQIRGGHRHGDKLSGRRVNSSWERWSFSVKRQNPSRVPDFATNKGRLNDGKSSDGLSLSRWGPVVTQSTMKWCGRSYSTRERKREEPRYVREQGKGECGAWADQEELSGGIGPHSNFSNPL
jgi:hypothetical protein